jgi:hypothetical protein
VGGKKVRWDRRGFVDYDGQDSVSVRKTAESLGGMPWGGCPGQARQTRQAMVVEGGRNRLMGWARRRKASPAGEGWA